MSGWEYIEMNKAGLARELARRIDVTEYQARRAVENLLDIIMREVAGGGSVLITGVGVFEPVDRAARTGRNPLTGELIRIEPKAVPNFRPADAFKRYVERPSSLPSRGLVAMRKSPSRKG